MIFKSLSLEEAKKRIEEMKKEMKQHVDGRVMVRQNRAYKGLEQNGVYTFNVHYDTPTSKNKEAIKVAAYNQGMHAGESHVIGGEYGYVIMVTTP